MDCAMLSPVLAALPPNGLLFLAAAAIVALVLLIAKLRCNAIVALVLISLLLGLAAGMQPIKVADAFREGVATTLGNLAMIIGLGTILGKMLAESGAAQIIATRMAALFGKERLDYAMMVVAFVVGVSVFFQVGIVLLGPIAFALARATGTPILRLGLPLAAGMSTAHGLIPPHPGPLAAINILGADVGKTIAWSLFVVGPPVALLTGPVLARWLVPRVPAPIGGLGAVASAEPSAPWRPGFSLAIVTMLLPVLLMLLDTAADVAWPDKSFPAGTWQAGVRTWTDFIGHPTVAMLIAVLVSFWSFGRHCGLDAARIMKFCEECLGPTAGVLLVIAAGGGFSKVLYASGVGDALAGAGGSLPISPLLLGWLVAGILRVAVGSATVAVTTAAGILLPFVQNDPTINRELLVLSMGAGSLILSHVNDGGFWFVKEYFGLTIEQTLKTWTVLETGIAVAALLILLLLDIFV